MIIEHTEPTSTDLRDSRRFANPICPYTRGYEDAAYGDMYCNAYVVGGVGGEDAREYDAGFEDGRRQSWILMTRGRR